MGIFVLKFGGKTIANVEKMRLAATRVQDCLNSGKQVAVVVSAMGDETDKLIELAATVDGCGYKRELDHLLFTGEVKSAALLTMVLVGMGIKAKSMNFANIGIKTDSEHFNAKVREVDASNIKKLLDEGFVPVIPGYQGMNSEGEVTTLGRGGSDITAVVIASELKAEQCVLFKDVGAIYYDDPKVNENVAKFDQLTYQELYEIVDRGCKVVCKDSIAIAKMNNLVISIANPETFKIGTVIS
jgi:aspartate kinase